MVRIMNQRISNYSVNPMIRWLNGFFHNIVNREQSSFVKFLNCALIFIFFILASIETGYYYKDTILKSPLLKIFGYILSCISLLIASLATGVYWFLTGIKEPFHLVGEELMFGSSTLRATLCLLPLGVVLALIVARIYNRLIISKVVGSILTIKLLVGVACLCYLLTKIM
jgi:hypothetical protein